MYVVRETIHCKPGKVREMVNKFKSVGGIMKRLGFQPFRLYTDVTGERFWTVVAEWDAETLDSFPEMEAKVMADAEAGKAMAGYHELVEQGRREIYKKAG